MKEKPRKAKHTPTVTTSTKNPKNKCWKFIFSVWTTRLHESFEDLNSSLAYAAGELSLVEIAISGRLTFFSAIFIFLLKMGFLTHNSGYRYVGRSIKGSKDVGDRLVYKNILSQKMAHWISAQGQVKLVKESKICPHCDVINRNKNV